MEDPDVPRLRHEIGGHAADDEHDVLPEQRIVGRLHGGVGRGKLLREHDEQRCQKLTGESPVYDRLGFLATPDLADDVGHEEGDRVAECGAGKHDSASEQGNARLNGLARHDVGDDEGDDEDHRAEQQVLIGSLHERFLSFFRLDGFEQPPGTAGIGLFRCAREGARCRIIAQMRRSVRRNSESGLPRRSHETPRCGRGMFRTCHRRHRRPHSMTM